MQCQYYNELGHECLLYNTKQDDYQRETYCEDSYKMQDCANYQEAVKTNSPRL